MNVETCLPPLDDRSNHVTTRKVFVYGTLKSGYGNNRLLEGASLLGEGQLPDHKCYYYGSVGSFPFVVKSKGTMVAGEVYEVDAATLRSLDSLEGYREGEPVRFYDRQASTIIMNDQTEISDVLYYLGNENWMDDPREVPSTDGVYCWSRLN